MNGKKATEILCYSSFFTKIPEFGRFMLETFIEVWFLLFGKTFMANGNLIRNAKREI